MVLNADDGRDPSAFLDLRGRDVAEPEVTDQPLLLQLGQGGQWRLD